VVWEELRAEAVKASIATAAVSEARKMESSTGRTVPVAPVLGRNPSRQRRG
jgi:hypothetical protein